MVVYDKCYTFWEELNLLQLLASPHCIIGQSHLNLGLARIDIHRWKSVEKIG
jgi:hypothetical protein